MSFEDLIVTIDGKNVKESDLVNHIVMIIDRSGSMSSLMTEIPGVFNSQLRDLKETAGDMRTTVSLITFETEVDKPIFWKKDIHEVRDMTSADYKLGGWTSLYDAIGTTVTKLKAEKDADDPKTSYLIVVITDGQENHSTEFSGKMLEMLMNEVKETKRWTFSFIGSNLDLEKETRSMGVADTNKLYFAQSNIGVGYVGSANLSGTSGRSGNSGVGGTMGYTPTGMTVTNSLDDAMNTHSASVKTYMNARKDIKQDADGSSVVFSASTQFYNDASDIKA
jgi:hypothetical protein